MRLRTNKTKKTQEIAVSLGLKLFKKGKEVCYIHSGTPKRFKERVRLVDWDVCLLNAYYGKHKDNFGEIREFTNSGRYTNKEDAMRAFEAFIGE